MATDFNSPEEIRKRAAANRARRRPTLRRPEPSAKFKASTAQPGRTGGAPRTPGSPQPRVKPQPTTVKPKGRFGKTVAALKSPVTLRGAAKTAGTVLKKIPGIAAVAGAIETPFAAGGALRKQAELPVSEIQARGGFVPSVVWEFGDIMTGGRATAVGEEISKSISGEPTDFRRAFLRGKTGDRAPSVPSVPSVPGQPATPITPRATFTPGGAIPQAQAPRLRTQPTAAQPAADLGARVSGIEAETSALREKRAAQYGIPVEALPYIDAGGRVSEVRKALGERLSEDLGPEEGALTAADAADIKLRQQRLGFDISKARGTATSAAEKTGRERAEFAQGQVDRLFQDVPEEQRGVRSAQFEEGFAGADFRTPQDFQQARQLQDVLEQARIAAEEATGVFSEGGFFEFADRLFGLNDPKVKALSAKEAATQIKSLVGENVAFGELLNESKTEFSPKTMKLLEVMRRNSAQGRRLRDF